MIGWRYVCVSLSFLSCLKFKSILIHVLLNMQTYFEFDLTKMVVRKYLEDKMQTAFREYRADLHKEYCEFKDPAEARANPPTRLTKPAD